MFFYGSVIAFADCINDAYLEILSVVKNASGVIVVITWDASTNIPTANN